MNAFLLPDIDRDVAAEVYFQTTRLALADAYGRTGDTQAYLRAHTELLDRTLRLALDRSGLPAEPLVVVAVGGYGRAELFPFSDIDLLILLDNEAARNQALRIKLESFVTWLWELKLTVGASVRSYEEYLAEAANDVSIATTYLESRVIWGNRTLYANAREDFYASLDARRFFREKMLELARRHQKFEDTPYALEPNLKESPGGLRDLQVFLWCAQAAGIAESVDEMKTSGLITERERDTLRDCADTLARFRITLHLLKKRHEDRLIFDIQEELAARLGYTADKRLRASEAMMKDYYRNAKAVVQMSVIQLQSIADRLLGDNSLATPIRLETAFVAKGDEMDIIDDEVFTRDRCAILRTFFVYHSHPELTRLSTRLLRALWHAVPLIDDEFCRHPQNQKVFLDILRMPKGAYHSLKLMNTWGVLGAFLPAFKHIVGQMQHDLYHVFTVDQHTLRAVRNIRRFARSEFAHEYPFCSQIMEELPDNWRLVIAGLFHDVGKGLGGKHEEIGAEKAERFCRTFRLDENTTDFIVFLVRHHLTMSQVAQKQDISDPAVVRRFLDIVQTKEKLDALYLLTVADIRATSAKVWNPWKAQLLETLYRSALDMLTGISAGNTAAQTLQRRKQHVLELLRDSVSTERQEELWKELDVVYFMRHSAEEIAWHTEVIAGRVDTPDPIVELRESEKMGGILLLIYLPDRKDLFLRIVAALGKNGLSVLDARIHTTRHGWALDTFLVVDRFGRLAPGELHTKIREDLRQCLMTGSPLPSTPKGRLSRRSRHFPTRPMITTTPDESGRAWILTIICTDRLGLLYSISQVLTRYAVNLQTAKIATLGERAEDVFLINSPLLRDDEQLLKLESDLVDAVSVPA